MITPNVEQFLGTKADYARRAANAVADSYLAYLNSFPWFGFTVNDGIVTTAVIDIDNVETTIVLDVGDTVLLDLGTSVSTSIVKAITPLVLSPIPAGNGRLRYQPEFRGLNALWTPSSTEHWRNVLRAQEPLILNAFEIARPSHVGQLGLAAAGLVLNGSQVFAPDARTTSPALVLLEPWMVEYGFLAAVSSFWIV